MRVDKKDPGSLVIYAVSLLLSLLMMTTSSTVLITIELIEGGVPAVVFYIFLGVIASTLVIVVISLRGLIREYSAASSTLERRRFVSTSIETPSNTHTFRQTYDPSLFSDPENKIISLLMENKNRILQSRIVQETGLSKATISRSLSLLENKGIIMRVRRGVTNEILLAETS